jgi:hypothetical protein
MEISKYPCDVMESYILSLSFFSLGGRLGGRGQGEKNKKKELQRKYLKSCR